MSIFFARSMLFDNEKFTTINIAAMKAIVTNVTVDSIILFVVGIFCLKNFLISSARFSIRQGQERRIFVVYNRPCY